MIRNHEKPIAMRAGLLTLLVHLLLGLLLVFSFQWKSIKPMQIATVELWDNLPSPESVKPTVPEKTPEPEKPVEPPKPVEPEKPVLPEKPVVTEKVDIKLKSKPEKPKPVKSKAKEKPEDELKKLQAALLNEATELSKQEKPKVAPAPTSAPTPVASPAAEVKSTVAVTGSTTDNSEIAKYIGLITAQIKQHVNHEVCGSNKTELQYMIQLMPSGMLIGKPQLQASNASPACNDAVERAILQAQPLKVPSGDLFNQFRLLKLKFKPNE